MSITVWDKYLPVLRIVLKRSAVSPQTFALNASDFERAGLKRKSGYKFLIKLNNGRLDNVLNDMPLASSLAVALLNDKMVKEFVSETEVHISMNSKYELTITSIAQQEKQEATAAVEETN